VVVDAAPQLWKGDGGVKARRRCHQSEPRTLRGSWRPPGVRPAGSRARAGPGRLRAAAVSLRGGQSAAGAAVRLTQGSRQRAGWAHARRLSGRTARLEGKPRFGGSTRLLRGVPGVATARRRQGKRGKAWDGRPAGILVPGRQLIGALRGLAPLAVLGVPRQRGRPGRCRGRAGLAGPTLGGAKARRRPRRVRDGAPRAGAGGAQGFARECLSAAKGGKAAGMGYRSSAAGKNSVVCAGPGALHPPRHPDYYPWRPIAGWRDGSAAFEPDREIAQAGRALSAI
jgi:hypothetical protein